MRAVWPWLIVLVLSCQKSPSTTDDLEGAPFPTPQDPSTGETTGGTTGGSTSGQTTGVTENRPLVWTTAATRYPVKVDHHATFIHASPAGAFVYVIGGIESDRLGNAAALYRETRRARLGHDGSVGEFETISTFAAPIAFHGIAKRNEWVYTFGGLSKDEQGFFAYPHMMVGRLGDDGVITWQKGPKHTETILHPAVEVLNGWLYSIGGTAGATVKSRVFRTKIGADGTLSALETAADLPEPRSHHTTVVYNGNVYVFGGLTTNNTVVTSLLRSVLDDQGIVVGWERVGQLDNPPWAAATVLRGDVLYLVGGGEGSSHHTAFVDKVRRALFLPSGTLSEWGDDQALPLARSHVHQVPGYGDYVFSIGGRVEGPPLSSTDVVLVGRWVEK